MFRSQAIRFATIALLLLALSPSIAMGAGLPTQIVPATCDGPHCTICDLADLAQNVLNTGIYIAVFLSAILFAWAGWKYVTAAGDSGAVGQARSIFTNVGIGLAIILASWLIIDTLMHVLLGEGTAAWPWNKIC